MNQQTSLLPAQLLRRPGPPTAGEGFSGVQIDDLRLAQVLSADAQLLYLYEDTVHGEGTVWDQVNNRVIWSDVTNRRLLAWHPDRQVQVIIDCISFINGNAVDGEGRVVRCEPSSGNLRRMADFEQPYGLFFSSDARTLYVSDAARALNDTPGPQTGRTHQILDLSA